MRARLPFWKPILLLAIVLIALGIRRHSGQQRLQDHNISESRSASEELEYPKGRVTAVVPSAVVAQTNEANPQVHGGLELPIRPNVSEANVAELIARLSDSEFRVRVAAGQALNRLGSNAAPAVPMIGYLLANEPQKVHDVMLRILEDCLPEAKATIPALQNCLTSSSVDLRINSARTLWVLDNSQAETVRPIAEACLNDAGAGPRIEAASLLWRMDRDPKEVVSTLAALLSDRDTAFDSRTIRLLNAIGPDAKEAVPALESWLASGRSKDAHEINTAMEALQTLRDSQ